MREYKKERKSYLKKKKLRKQQEKDDNLKEGDYEDL